MKTRIHTLALLLAVLSLASCASPSDPAFMKNAAASINGGTLDTEQGPQFSPGIHPEQRPHPFFAR